MSTQTLERPPARPKRGRRLLFRVGVGLILAGLVVLAYVAWQVFGTNVVAHQKQQEIVDQTEKVWDAQARGGGSPEDAGADAGGAGDAGDGAGASGGASSVALTGASALVRIPRFGESYVMPIQKGVSDQVLAEGFGHFDESARPGGVGNYALAAHRVTHGEPLRNMPQLRPGDEILVETRKATYTYRLDTDPNQLIVTFADVWVIDKLPKNPDGGVQPAQRPGQRLITLTTCAELFHTDNRMIAFGHLVDTTPR